MILLPLCLFITACLNIPNLAEILPEEDQSPRANERLLQEEIEPSDEEAVIDTGSLEGKSEPDLSALFENRLDEVPVIPARADRTGLTDTLARRPELTRANPRIQLLPKGTGAYQLPVVDLLDRDSVLTVRGIDLESTSVSLTDLRFELDEDRELEQDEPFLRLEGAGELIFLFFEPPLSLSLLLTFEQPLEQPLEIGVESVDLITSILLTESNQVIESGDILRFKVDVPENGLLLTEMIPTEEFDGVLEIYGPAGYILTLDEAGAGEAEQLSYNVTAAGEYTLVVFGFQGDTGTFDFDLKFIPVSSP